MGAKYLYDIAKFEQMLALVSEQGESWHLFLSYQLMFLF